MQGTLKLSDCVGDWALVTGASSGIGAEFAAQLAGRGMNVVLVARRADRLEQLARELVKQHNVDCVVLVADIAESGAAAALKSQLAERGIRIRLLCNNAGFGQWGYFEGVAAERYAAMVRVNVIAPVALCREFVEDLASHPSSAIVNVSSPAAYQPVPYMAVYAATKAFMQSFSQALHGEWAGRGVVVQCLVPGPTDTEFDRLAGAYETSLSERRPPGEAVAASLTGLESGTPVEASAKGILKQRLFASLFSPRVVIRQVGKLFRPPDRKL